jgi:predicted alpha/beta hydrolase family esterase
VSTLDRCIQKSSRPVILVAHSLGNIVVSHWASTHSGPVVGALLVAPADVDAEWAPRGSLYKEFCPIPLGILPFPTILIASTDDPYLSCPRAENLASAWHSSLQFVGPKGHIGSDSKLGNWPKGRRLLDQLIEQAIQAQNHAT